MAIRLRRGLNADRTTITPETGEPLWTTDTKKLYIGDGTTVGGNLVGGVGTVTSVGMTVPSAFSVTPSAITTSGTFAVTGAGNASQYVRGDGTLAAYSPGSGGGGSSQTFYFNGSVASGVSGYQQMSTVANTGASSDFSISADGYIASFLTDVGSPNQLNIPAGNWNFEIYMNANSGGGTPSFYVELYKYASSTFTLIATSSANPEYITNGTSVDLYTTSLSVSATTLASTDRLAVRFYVTHSGRTITMHTQDSNLSDVITTFSTGMTALNGLTAQVQLFSTGTSGTDFAISSTGSTHTFNLPTASATNRGALSSANWTTFNGKQDALSGTGFVKISGTTISYDNSTYLTGNQSIALTGDVSGTGSTAITTTIGANKVLNTMLAQVATATFKGRATPSTGNVEDLTATQATALLDIFTPTLKGLVPSGSGGGTANFLRADGSWAAPAGSGGTTTNSLVIKADSGTTEGTDLYTFNGSSAKTINIVAGTNITISKASGTLTISSAGGSSDNPVTLMTAFLNYT